MMKEDVLSATGTTAEEYDGGVEGFRLPSTTLPVSQMMISLSVEFSTMQMRLLVNNDEDCVFLYRVVGCALKHYIPIDKPIRTPLPSFPSGSILASLLYAWKSTPNSPEQTETARKRIVTYLAESVQATE